MEDDIKSNTPTFTTAAGLTQLAAGISELLHNKSLDNRFVAKLYKRLEKEAQAASQTGERFGGPAEQFALQQALAGLKQALTKSETTLLVEIYSRLRAHDAQAAAPAP
jgi:hypothetical protein